jgi:DNA adenine methylase
MSDIPNYISKYLMWRQETSNLTRNGIIQIKTSLKLFTNFLNDYNIGNIENITYDIIKDYQEYLSCTKTKNGIVRKITTQNNAIVIMKGFFRWLLKEGFLISDPSANIEYAKDPKKLKNNLNKNYPGGKGGIFQRLINLMPPHEIYIETHLGNGAVMRRKRSAKLNIGIEIDSKVMQMWKNEDHIDIELIHGDAIPFLIRYRYTGKELIYCDPPYLRETRKKYAPIYKHEYTFNKHEELLEVLKILPCKVMISGYQSTLYSKKLKNWHTQFFQASTSNGVATEWVWMNFSPPLELHDYSYLGNDFRQRERIRNKKNRWITRLNKMSARDKQILLNAIKWVWMSYSDSYKLYDYHSLGNNFRERARRNNKRQRWIKQLQTMPVLEKQTLLDAIRTPGIYLGLSDFRKEKTLTKQLAINRPRNYPIPCEGLI